MSLTNPNTVVTEKRLNDFYKGILPYLGGMPEMVANKFSKGDIYSTEEKMVGQWIDGKPLYQRTIKYEYADGTNIPSSPLTLGCDGTEEIKSIVDALFKYKNTTTNQIEYAPVATLFNTPYLNEWFLALSNCNTNTNSIGFNAGSGWRNATYIEIVLSFTIKYTKSSDSAISIGNDTDYSTDEKIIGTWIDGSPVWQRVINFDSYISVGTTWVSTGVDSSYVDEFISVIARRQECIIPVQASCVGSGNTFELRSSMSNQNVSQLIIQYTKAN